MDKYCRLLNLLEEYNETHGEAHTVEFLEKCASAIGAEISWDGWFAEGFCSETGYFPVIE